ncbi:hypothetical protein BsWGS_08315 [Bradybaena similaris]
MKPRWLLVASLMLVVTLTHSSGGGSNMDVPNKRMNQRSKKMKQAGKNNKIRKNSGCNCDKCGKPPMFNHNDWLANQKEYMDLAMKCSADPNCTLHQKSEVLWSDFPLPQQKKRKNRKNSGCHCDKCGKSPMINHTNWLANQKEFMDLAMECVADPNCILHQTSEMPWSHFILLQQNKSKIQEKSRCHGDECGKSYELSHTDWLDMMKEYNDFARECFADPYCILHQKSELPWTHIRLPQQKKSKMQSTTETPCCSCELSDINIGGLLDATKSVIKMDNKFWWDLFSWISGPAKQDKSKKKKASCCPCGLSDMSEWQLAKASYEIISEYSRRRKRRWHEYKNLTDDQKRELFGPKLGCRGYMCGQSHVAGHAGSLAMKNAIQKKAIECANNPYCFTPARGRTVVESLGSHVRSLRSLLRQGAQAS